MNSRQTLNKWVRVAALLALASLTTMGFTVPDRGSLGPTISADVVCALITEIDLSYIPDDVRSHLCFDSAESANPAPVFEVDSLTWSDAYRAVQDQIAREQDAQFARALALEGDSKAWTEQYLWAQELTEREGNEAYVRAVLGLEGDSRAWTEQYLWAMELTEREANAAYEREVITFSPLGKIGGASDLWELEQALEEVLNP